MRKFLLSLVSFVALCALIGCGTSNNTISIPPNPSGGNAAGFSNTSLASGTSYVFSVSGINTTGSFAVVGTFVTDGNGNIAAGTRDTVNDAGGQNLGETITTTSSSYFVNGDGRGQLILNGPSGQVIYRFVLHAPTAQQPSLVGELFQDGTTSDRVIVDALGTIEQVSGAPATPTGNYVVRLDGEDSNLNPYGAIGGITFNANNFTGSIDENDNGGYAQETQPLAANGTIALSSSRGTATLTTPSGINPATHNFVVYYISPTHLELVSTDRNFFLYGSATQQASFAASNAAFASNQVFALSGVDDSGPGNTIAPRDELGRLTLNGDGTFGNAIEDWVDLDNAFSGVSFATQSSYTVGANGRWTANLPHASDSSNTDLVGWQVSFGPLPQNQKSLVLTTDSNILETGVMLGQTLGLNDASITGNYAETLSGYSGGQGYIELTGNLCTSSVLCASPTASGSFSGTYDAQTDSGGLFLDTAASGTYTIDPVLGRSTAANLQNIPVANIPVAMYTVDADTILFVSAQQGAIYQGAIINQQ